MSQPTKNSVAADSAFEIAPYGDVSELLSHTTTRFALIRADGTVIGDLSEDEARLFSAAPALLAKVKKDQDNLHFWAAHPRHDPALCTEPSCIEARALIAKAQGVVETLSGPWWTKS